MKQSDEEIEKAFEEWRVICPFSRTTFPNQQAFEAGYKTGAKAERERVLEDVEKICDKVIESWENAYDPSGGLGAQVVIDLIQKLKQETK